MGCLEYTPSAIPAIAKVNYHGKDYKFSLPKALPNGYVLKINYNAGAISVEVACNASTPQDTKTIFVNHQGRPYAYQLISCQVNKPQSFTLLSRK